MAKPIITYPEENPRWIAFRNLRAKLWSTDTITHLAIPPDETVGQKLLDFFEHGWVITVFGIVGTLVGFFYTPVLTVCGIAIVLAFQRVGVVKGQKLGVQCLAYLCLFTLTFFALYWADRAVRDNLPHIPTVQEIGDYILQRQPKVTLLHPEIEKLKEKAGPPFSFAVEVGLVSPGVDDFTGLWVETGSPQGCVLIPIDDLLFFRVSNIQPTPKLLVNYTVEARMKGGWHPLKKVKLVYQTAIETLTSSTEKGENPQGGGTLEFPSSGSKNMYPIMDISTGEGDFKRARVVNFPIFDFLIGGQTLAQGQSVRGWSAFQFPSLISINDLRMKVTDETGETHTIMPTIIKSGPDEDLTPHPITIASLIDVSRCTRGLDH